MIISPLTLAVKCTSTSKFSLIWIFRLAGFSSTGFSSSFSSSSVSVLVPPTGVLVFFTISPAGDDCPSISLLASAVLGCGLRLPKVVFALSVVSVLQSVSHRSYSGMFQLTATSLRNLAEQNDGGARYVIKDRVLCSIACIQYQFMHAAMTY